MKKKAPRREGAWELMLGGMLLGQREVFILNNIKKEILEPKNQNPILTLDISQLCSSNMNSFFLPTPIMHKE